MPNDISLPASHWSSTSWQYQLGKAADVAGDGDGNVSLVELDTFEVKNPLPAGISPEDANELRKEIVLNGSSTTGGTTGTTLVGPYAKSLQKMIDLCAAAGVTDQTAAITTLDKMQAANPGNGQVGYPNGQTARDLNGNWYYPTGTFAGNGTQFGYPNGQTARDLNGNWYYPTGTFAGNG